MEDRFFQDYSEKHVHFYDESFPVFLELGLSLINNVEKPSMVDLGCGDGRLLFALYKKGLLNRFSEIVGVDISEKRIERLAKQMSFVKGVVSDASNVKELPSSFFDYVICSQVIEHVRDDAALVSEIKRLLKCGGVTFVSSIVKEWYGVYFYISDGSFRLDPTHVREYSSVDEFVSLLQARGFEIINFETRQIMFPFIDLLLRLFSRVGLIELNSVFFRKKQPLSKIRGFQMPVFGYKSVDVIAKKIE